MESRFIGRLAVCSRAGYPLVFPVNYVFNSGEIIFRTGLGTKRDLSVDSLVTFEVDDFDVNTRTGWSVVVHGVVQLMPEMGMIMLDRPFEDAGAGPWAPGERSIWMRIVPQVLTGRRIRWTEKEENDSVNK